ncbi:MAG: acylphosphatase [Balneolaceae bacterium]|nr:acylphosphatase [Balneolaceae bacterium]
MVTKKVKIFGRVQGVGFRHYTKQNAARLNIRGWVKNMPDGTVEALLAGDEENVEEMLEKLESGPVPARVDRMEVDEANPDTLPDAFSVKR